MGNVWGIANPGFVPAPSLGGADVPISAGVVTTVISIGPLAANTPGDYFPLILGALSILLGATPPTALSASFNINGGSTVTSQLFPAAALLANATIYFPFSLVGLNSGTAWVGAGSTINIQVSSPGQPVTFKNSGSLAVVLLFRGIDA